MNDLLFFTFLFVAGTSYLLGWFAHKVSMRNREKQ